MKNKFQLLFIAVLILSLSLVIAIEEIGSDRGSLTVGKGEICVGSPEECEREPPPQDSTCGDGFVDTARGEQCDGSNLNGHSCSSLFGSSFTGSLSCQPNCIYDATACSQTTTTPPNNNNGGGGSSGGGGGSGGGSTIINSAQQTGSGGCVENWECQEWQACVASSQIRLCTDKNNCSTTIIKPETERLCGTPALLNNPTTQEITDGGVFGRIGSLLGAVIGAGANRYSAAIVIGFILFIIAIALVINMVRGKQKKPEVSE